MISTFTLENDFVKLSPLGLENYLHLVPIASQKKLVQYSPSDIECPESLKKYVEIALEQQRQKTGIPFIIYDKTKKSYAGSTRYMNIDWRNQVLHIGSTWIGREFQGSGLNRVYSESKFVTKNYFSDFQHGHTSILSHFNGASLKDSVF